MKSLKTTTASKLMSRFDHELKKILMNDLKNIRSAKSTIVTTIEKGLDPNTLSAA